MHTAALRAIGLSENEIALYLALLRSGPLTAYELGQKTGIYRVHVYDKLEKLIAKGLVTHVYEGSRKHFLATPPEKLMHFLEEKKRAISSQEAEIKMLLPELRRFAQSHEQPTRVEVFSGIEGIKYFLRDMVKIAPREVLIMGTNDAQYQENLPLFIRSHFRNLKKHGIRERVITSARPGTFVFSKKVAPTTTYRFLEAGQFNPTNTLIYGHTVVMVSWDLPPSAIMIQNKNIADTYREHFEHLWRIAATKPLPS